MKLSLSSAMRARDVSRPRPEHLADAEVAERAAQMLEPRTAARPPAVTEPPEPQASPASPAGPARPAGPADPARPAGPGEPIEPIAGIGAEPDAGTPKDADAEPRSQKRTRNRRPRPR